MIKLSNGRLKRPVTGVVPLCVGAVDVRDFPIEDATITIDLHDRSVEITGARLDVNVDGDVIMMRFSGWASEDDALAIELRGEPA